MNSITETSVYICAYGINCLLIFSQTAKNLCNKYFFLSDYHVFPSFCSFISNGIDVNKFSSYHQYHS